MITPSEDVHLYSDVNGPNALVSDDQAAYFLIPFFPVERFIRSCVVVRRASFGSSAILIINSSGLILCLSVHCDRHSLKSSSVNGGNFFPQISKISAMSRMQSMILASESSPVTVPPLSETRLG